MVNLERVESSLEDAAWHIKACNGRTDGRTDRYTDGPMHGRKDVHGGTRRQNNGRIQEYQRTRKGAVGSAKGSINNERLMHREPTESCPSQQRRDMSRGRMKSVITHDLYSIIIHEMGL